MPDWLDYFVALASVIFVIVPVSADVIRVPADAPTIQEAIDVAVDGDTVLVAPGTYVENIDFIGKAITVTSDSGPEVTIIDGNAAGSVVTFGSGEQSTSLFSGFTVQNGRADLGPGGGGIQILDASPTINNNLITNNSACTGLGVSVFFASPIIQGNIIADNTNGYCPAGRGAGINIGGVANAQILDNIISNNGGVIGSGGGIALNSAGNPTIRGNVIDGNSVTGSGGGIYMINLSDALIIQNIITNNIAVDQGGGIYWSVPSSGLGPLLVNNTIADNDVGEGLGSAIFAEGFDAHPLLVNNIIVGTPGQTALYCGGFNDLSFPILEFNNIHSDGAPAYGGFCDDQTGLNGNISADPEFANPDLFDFRLSPDSPAIDRGDNEAPDLPDSDFDKNDRIVDGDGDGEAVVDMGALEFNAIMGVAIDIRPGSRRNIINLRSRGRIPVAILSSAEFDAPGKVDEGSLTFGGTGDEQSLDFCLGRGVDMNGDGRSDLTCVFRTRAAGFEPGDSEGVLKGETLDGVPIVGRDMIRVIGPRPRLVRSP